MAAEISQRLTVRRWLAIGVVTLLLACVAAAVSDPFDRVQPGKPTHPETFQAPLEGVVLFRPCVEKVLKHAGDVTLDQFEDVLDELACVPVPNF